MLFSRSDEGSDWFRKVKRIYLIKTQIVVLKVMKQFCVCAATGAERFDRERARTSLTKMGEKQGGQHCFADGGVSACDKNCSGVQIRHYESGVTTILQLECAKELLRLKSMD